MINLVSNSETRALLLKEAGISFVQIPFEFDESGVKKDDALNYAYRVVNVKKEQFFAASNLRENLLFADSCVVVDGQIFGKAKDDDEARFMLKKQSNSQTSVVTALLFLSEARNLVNVSVATYKFAEFSEQEMEIYIKSGDYLGKAGAMMIEGFNKKYILSQIGRTTTARGLNTELLKGYLW